MAIYSGFSQLKIVIFHGYVSLPEGITNLVQGFSPAMSTLDFAKPWLINCGYPK